MSVRSILLLSAFWASVLGGRAIAQDAGDPPPLSAPQGITAIAGQVVDLQNQGLPGVQVSDQQETTRTDSLGRFVLTYTPVGPSVLRIDARHLGAKHDQDYGLYEIRVETRAGQTTVLPDKSWLPRIDDAHAVSIPSPTKTPLTIQTPAIPGLELHIPAGTVITDIDGHPVTMLSITAIPPDRSPWPHHGELRFKTLFTIQPGAACLYTASGGIGSATLTYPNVSHELPKARATFWRYEPDGQGWAPRGMGSVSADGTQIVPDTGTEIYDFASAECDPTTRSHMALPERVRPQGATGSSLR